MMILQVAIETPIRKNKNPNKLWREEDKGIIKAWELGREWAVLYPEKSLSAKHGILLELKRKQGESLDDNTKTKHVRLFKGGFDERLKSEPYKYGSLHYYAMWLGLRGDDLTIDLEKEYPLVCSKTKMGVVYTLDSKKYLSTKINSKELERYGEDFIEAVGEIT